MTTRENLENTANQWKQAQQRANAKHVRKGVEFPHPALQQANAPAVRPPEQEGLNQRTGPGRFHPPHQCTHRYTPAIVFEFEISNYDSTDAALSARFTRLLRC